MALDTETMDALRITAVVTHVRNILRHGRDVYRARPSPLLADAIAVRCGSHLAWRFPDGGESVVSNFSCQQNLMRVLAGLSNLTGDMGYKRVAIDNIQYYFTHQQSENGLLRWGGHQFVDLRTLEAVGPSEKNHVHELKNALPYYELMFEANPAAVRKFIRGFWNAHVSGPSMEISRHGKFTKAIDPHTLWNTAHYVKPQPYRETKGLSFLSAGNDLIYAGAVLSQHTGNQAAWISAMRLADQFSSARHATTKLGAYQFSQPIKSAEPTSDDETRSHFGDRAQRQLGPELEPSPAPPPLRRKVLEATMLLEAHARTIYSHNALVQLEIARSLPQRGAPLLASTVEGLLAFKQHAYDAGSNTFRPMLTDGTDLANYVLKRNGYYGAAGSVLNAYPASCLYLLSYARAYRLAGGPALWQAARELALKNDLGDWGDGAGKPSVNLASTQGDPLSLFAVLDIYWKTKLPDYLALARVIGNNLYHQRFVHDAGGRHAGYFMPSRDHVYVNVDTIEPYALLALQAAIDDRENAVPTFINGAGYTEGEYRMPDGTSATLQDKALYQLTTGQPRPE